MTEAAADFGAWRTAASFFSDDAKGHTSSVACCAVRYCLPGAARAALLMHAAARMHDPPVWDLPPNLPLVSRVSRV